MRPGSERRNGRFNKKGAPHRRMLPPHTGIQVSVNLEFDFHDALVVDACPLLTWRSGRLSDPSASRDTTLAGASVVVKPDDRLGAAAASPAARLPADSAPVRRQKAPLTNFRKDRIFLPCRQPAVRCVKLNAPDCGKQVLLGRLDSASNPVQNRNEIRRGRELANRH